MTDSEWNDADGWDGKRTVAGLVWKNCSSQGIWYSRSGHVVGRIDGSNRQWALETPGEQGHDIYDSCKEAMGAAAVA